MLNRYCFVKILSETFNIFDFIGSIVSSGDFLLLLSFLGDKSLCSFRLESEMSHLLFDELVDTLVFLVPFLDDRLESWQFLVQ